MTSLPDKPDLSRLTIARGSDAGSGSGRRFAPLVWIGVVVLVIVFCGYLLRGELGTADRKMSVQIAPEHAVETPRRASANSSVLNATGYVVAQRQAAVSSKATGRLKELRVKEGDRVAENEIIGVLENDDLLHIIAKEKAALEAAKARVAYAEAELAVAEIELKRVLPLAEQRAVSQSEKDAAEARYRRAVADLAAQRAGVALAEAGVKEAEVNFEYTLILSPFAGTVLTKNADIGEIVAPYGTSSDARAAVVTIADMESLQVEADVSEANIAKVAVGQTCKITLDSFPGKIYQGAVDSIVPTVDRAKATVLVKISFLNKDSSVIPEMSAKVEFELGT